MRRWRNRSAGPLPEPRSNNNGNTNPETPVVANSHVECQLFYGCNMSIQGITQRGALDNVAIIRIDIAGTKPYSLLEIIASLLTGKTLTTVPLTKQELDTFALMQFCKKTGLSKDRISYFDAGGDGTLRDPAPCLGDTFEVAAGVLVQPVIPDPKTPESDLGSGKIDQKMESKNKEQVDVQPENR